MGCREVFFTGFLMLLFYLLCFLVYYVSFIKVFIYSISSDIAGPLLMHMELHLMPTATSRVTCQTTLVIHLVTDVHAFDKNVFLPQVDHNRNIKD